MGEAQHRNLIFTLNLRTSRILVAVWHSTPRLTGVEGDV